MLQTGGWQGNCHCGAFRPAIGADRWRMRAAEILQQSQKPDLDQLFGILLEAPKSFLLWFQERYGGAASIEACGILLASH